MSIINLLKVSYWFSLYTPPFQRVSFVIALVVLVLLLVIAIVLRGAVKKYANNPPLVKSLKKVARPLFFFSITAFVFVLFRQAGATILSARFWILLILLVSVAWFVWVFLAIRKNYSAEYSRLQERKKYEVYLPKKKF